jgi:hypothetical protein
MYVPKATGILVSPKQNDSIKGFKTAIVTPAVKAKQPKRSVKENGYHTAFNSNNNSYISTPFDCEPVEIK